MMRSDDYHQGRTPNLDPNAEAGSRFNSDA